VQSPPSNAPEANPRAVPSTADSRAGETDGLPSPHEKNCAEIDARSRNGAITSAATHPRAPSRLPRQPGRRVGPPPLSSPARKDRRVAGASAAAGAEVAVRAAERRRSRRVPREVLRADHRAIETSILRN